MLSSEILPECANVYLPQHDSRLLIEVMRRCCHPAAMRVADLCTGSGVAAIAAAEHVGVAPDQAAQALARFENVKRRMELRGQVRGISVYDDFAHHPTAIRTTVDGLRRKLNAEGKKGERILAIFEPRSNTMKLGTMKSQLPWSLEQADQAFCHSGGLDWDAAAALAEMGARAQVAGTIDALIEQVMAAVQAGDHLLCMSNGGFGGIHAKLLERLVQP